MILTVDIGGTAIKYGFFNEETQRIVELGRIPTRAKEDNFSMALRLNELLQTAMNQIEISGIAISSAGTIDPINGLVVQANENLPGYTGTDLKGYLEKTYHVPVSVVNDADAALLGELHYGTHRGHTNAVMLTIGTGLGCAIVVNDELLVGHSFSAGEVGYIEIDGQSIEQIISTTALVNYVKQRTDNDDIDGYWIFDQAKKGNKVAREAIDWLIDNLMTFVKTTVGLINPSIVILGGGIMEQEELLQQPILNNFASYPNPLVRSQTAIEFASLGNAAGMYGAYYWYCQKYL